jgi:chromosome partitioning protein
MQRIIILNPKGGSGKTTIATNLASLFAASGHNPALLDLDPQGSTIRWLAKRKPDLPAIHGIAGYERAGAVTRSWQLRIPTECDTVIVDTPAAIEPQRFPEITRGADAVLVPVMPSDIDIHAAAKCIADLLLVAKIRRSEGRLGVIANRVRSNTLISQSLMRFLCSLDIPLVTTLRDTQNYVRATQSGTGVIDMPDWQGRRDKEDWTKLERWLQERRRPEPAVGGDNLVSILS